MIYAQVITDETLLSRIKGLYGQTRVELGRALWRIVIRLQRKVKEDKLSGQVLHVRTGTLRRSINAQVTDKGYAMYGVVGTNVKYAPVHEYGFQGPVAIKAHFRMMREAWGRPVRARRIQVSAHTRQVNLPMRSFLRSALADMAPQIQTELEAAVKVAVEASK